LTRTGQTAPHACERHRHHHLSPPQQHQRRRAATMTAPQQRLPTRCFLALTEEVVPRRGAPPPSTVAGAATLPVCLPMQTSLQERRPVLQVEDARYHCCYHHQRHQRLLQPHRRGACLLCSLPQSASQRACGVVVTLAIETCVIITNNFYIYKTKQKKPRETCVTTNTHHTEGLRAFMRSLEHSVRCGQQQNQNDAKGIAIEHAQTECTTISRALLTAPPCADSRCPNPRASSASREDDGAQPAGAPRVQESARLQNHHCSPVGSCRHHQLWEMTSHCDSHLVACHSR
jgi:hypothetical protein